MQEALTPQQHKNAGTERRNGQTICNNQYYYKDTRKTMDKDNTPGNCNGAEKRKETNLMEKTERK
jgi:hypothetical protein